MLFQMGTLSNRAMMQHMVALNPNALYLQGHCLAHLLQIVWDIGARKRLASPLHGFVQLMDNGSQVIRMRAAMDSLGAGAGVTVGLEPPDGDFNRLILDYRFRRQLLVQIVSLNQVGAVMILLNMPRSSHKFMPEVNQGLTSPWYGRVCTHHCWGPLPGSRCCVSIIQARTRICTSLSALSRY